MIKIKLFEDFETDKIKEDFLYDLNLDELEIKFDFTSHFDMLIFYFDNNDYICEHNKYGNYFSISYSIYDDSIYDEKYLYLLKNDIINSFKLKKTIDIYSEPNNIRRSKEKLFNENI